MRKFFFFFFFARKTIVQAVKISQSAHAYVCQNNQSVSFPACHFQKLVCQ